MENKAASDRVILHCDLNNFYASVACLDNPTLYGMPIAVAGSVEKRHGIILAKNEIAKKFGIKTGEAIWEAEQKCPNLILVPPNYKRQNEISKKVFHIYERYTELVEPFGADECWLDVTGSVPLFGSGVKIADDIRKTVKREVGLTISVGVSFNKMFAKLGSDLKKPDAVSELSRENFRDKIWHLPVSALFGVGRKTGAKLRAFGVFTIGDLAVCSPQVLHNAFGVCGLQIRSFANGLDDGAVLSKQLAPDPKSVSRSTTTPFDIVDYDQVWKIYMSMSEEIALQLREYKQTAFGIRVHLRTTQLQVMDFECSYNQPTDLSAVIARRGMELFRKSYDFSAPLRSVGIGVYDLMKNGFYQQGIFEDADELQRFQNQDDRLFSVRNRFGEESLLRARMI